MKRFAWLILLVSLGLNTGLGWRLFSESRNEPAAGPGFHGFGPENRNWRQGSQMERGRQGKGLSWQRRSEFFRPAPGDSNAWREIMEHRLERITTRLGLDEDQVESFRATHLEAANRFRGQRRLVEEAEDRLFKLASGSQIKADSVRAAVKDLGRRKARLDSLVTEAMLQELDSLSPEQRELYLRILPWSGTGGGDGGPRGGRPYGKPNRSAVLPGE